MAVVVDVFPALCGLRSRPFRSPLFLPPSPLFGVWVRGRKVVVVRDFEHVGLGVVRDLAVALVDHVFPHRVDSPELTAFPVAVDADVAHRDLLSEVRDQPGRIGEVFDVGDEERVFAGHVEEIVCYRRGNVRAEEAVGRRKSRACGGYFLVQC